MKTAYFVVGAEPSGTRMLTEFLVRAGCFGHFGHWQKMDNLNFSEQPDRIAFRRSLPHGDRWPDLDKIMGRMREAGYEVVLLNIIRDKDYCAASQVRAGHASTPEQARRNIHEAQRQVYAAAAGNAVRPVVVLYEDFVTHAEARQHLVHLCGLDLPDMTFVDGNDKYSLAV